MNDDFELVDTVYMNICKRVEKDVRQKISMEERNIVLIWDAIGLIGNGGFQWYLRGEMAWTDAPNAFIVVGVPEVADAFQAILSLYPNDTPLADDKQRMNVISKFQEKHSDQYDKLNKIVWSSKDRVVTKTAAYIRRHPELLKMTAEDCPP